MVVLIGFDLNELVSPFLHKVSFRITDCSISYGGQLFVQFCALFQSISGIFVLYFLPVVWRVNNIKVWSMTNMTNMIQHPKNQEIPYKKISSVNMQR